MAKHEAKYTAMLRRALEEMGAWAYKIPDAPIMPTAMGFRGKPVARPFDLVVCLDVFFYAIEVKYMNGYQAFGQRHMRPSQIQHLTAVSAAGGAAYVALFVQVSPRTLHLHLFSWGELQRIWENGSIRGADLKQYMPIDWSKPANRHLSPEDLDLNLF